MSWQGIRPPKYVHFPIPDLSVPQDSDSLNALLGRIISTGRSAVVHCTCTAGVGVGELLGSWAHAFSHSRLPYCCPDLDESSVFGCKPYRRHTTHHHQGLMRAHCLARSSARRK
jgi:hypothetical protein